MKDNHQMRNYARENRILYNSKTFAAIFVTYMKKKTNATNAYIAQFR